MTKIDFEIRKNFENRKKIFNFFLKIICLLSKVLFVDVPFRGRFFTGAIHLHRCDYFEYLFLVVGSWMLTIRLLSENFEFELNAVKIPFSWYFLFYPDCKLVLFLNDELMRIVLIYIVNCCILNCTPRIRFSNSTFAQCITALFFNRVRTNIFPFSYPLVTCLH